MSFLLRRLAPLWLAVWVAVLPGVAFAETAGIISGTVTDDRTRAPIAGVAVVAKSPSATYRTTTDAKGQYRFLSVLPDNYSVSFTKSGYASYSTIVVVINGSLQTVNAPISRTLKVIASTHARSAGSAFQRGMTIDTYTVTGSQIDMVQGKAFNTNENQLLRSIPSVTIDKSGTVSIRGGFAFEAAYEFEGIDYTTPSANLQNTLQNISNFGLLNGVGSVQLIPGGGDATHGDTGTGLVLFTAKHGTYPSYFHVDAEAQMFPYLHQLGLEWGWADPSQRFSNYAGFIGERKAFQYGIAGTAANTLGTLGTNAATLGSTIDPNLVYYSPSYLSSNDFVDNAIYRFGKNNSQRLQFFIQDQAITQTLDYGGFQFLPYISGGTTAGRCAPYPVNGPGGPVNSTQQNFACDSLIPLFPGQPNTYAFVSNPDTLRSPFLAYKFEYGAQLGSTTAVTARYFRTFEQQSQDMPAQGIFADPYGGTRTAGQIDFTTQLGEKNLFKYGAIYQWVVPYGNRYDFTSYSAFTTPSFVVTYPITHPNQPLPLPYTYTGLLPNNNPSSQQGLEQDFFSPSFCGQIGLHSNCGYLSSYFPGGVRFPFEEDISTVGQQQYGAYLQDSADLSNKWKTEAGLRLDGYNFQIPTQVGAPASIPAVEHQRLYEPHFDLSYAPDNRDTIRLGFGHTLSMPIPSLLGAESARRPMPPSRGFRLTTTPRAKPQSTAGRWPMRSAATTPTSSTGSRATTATAVRRWRRRWSAQPSPTSTFPGRTSFATARRSSSRRFTGAATTSSSRPPRSSATTIRRALRSSATFSIPIWGFKRRPESKRSTTATSPWASRCRSAPPISASSATSRRARSCSRRHWHWERSTVLPTFRRFR